MRLRLPWVRVPARSAFHDPEEADRLDALLTAWRRSPLPSPDESDALRAAMAGRVPPETFALCPAEALRDLDETLARGGSVSSCLRRRGLAVGYPRTDVAMSLVWLACGEGDALARMWMASALCRLASAGGEAAPDLAALAAEHLDAAGIGRMGFDGPGLRALGEGLLPGLAPGRHETPLPAAAPWRTEVPAGTRIG